MDMLLIKTLMNDGKLSNSPTLSWLSLWRLFLRPLERFFGRYVIQKGYRDGTHGLVLALLIALNYFIRELKLWETNLRNRNKR